MLWDWGGDRPTIYVFLNHKSRLPASLLPRSLPPPPPFPLPFSFAHPKKMVSRHERLCKDVSRGRVRTEQLRARHLLALRTYLATEQQRKSGENFMRVPK